MKNNYESKLNLKETQIAIKLVKDTFERKLSKVLNLHRVSAPVIVFSKDKINDDLGSKNSALTFNIPNLDNKDIEIVQSLAKWKRMALLRYGFSMYEGIYTDMNALRPNDIIDNIHSIYVDQWDWELIIKREDRTLNFLKEVVRKIMCALHETKVVVNKEFPVLKETICKDVFFISSEDLIRKYPGKNLLEREYLITKEYKTVFIYGISPRDGESMRAPDYDDWSLNGDILMWSDTLGDAIEISSMGIRVDEVSLEKQIAISKREDLLKGRYHQMILNKELPLTIGGGIGQSRICMILLEKFHIAEVQASHWSEDELKKLKKWGINIL
ncbi:MAG: aspartate--ammonia ligase [Acholeplasmataceae bacterium]|nr:aspartate--ammonia ligase [Acholeplasmataceae bacterium]